MNDVDQDRQQEPPGHMPDQATAKALYEASPAGRWLDNCVRESNAMAEVDQLSNQRGRSRPRFDFDGLLVGEFRLDTNTGTPKVYLALRERPGAEPTVIQWQQLLRLRDWLNLMLPAHVAPAAPDMPVIHH